MGFNLSDFALFPSHWKICRVGDFADVKSGKRLPKDRQLTSVPTVHPYIRVVDFRDGRIDHSNLQYVPDDVFPRISRYTISKKDIYISIVGTIGLVGIVDKSLDGANLTENAAKICNIQSHLNRDYLAYYLRSPWGRYEINAQTVGSTQPKLALFRIKDIRVPVPPVREQKAIAYILGTLDDKIELNRRMNETLEAMARAIFKSWFVDFDPVVAKAEGRKPADMSAETARLFPDSFEDSDLGKIPKGWKVKNIGDVCSFEYGKALKASDRQDGDIPVYGSNGQVGWHDEKLVDGPGIVVGRKGNPGIVKWVHTDFFPIDTTFYVVPKDATYTLNYLFYVLEWEDLASLGADSAVPGLNRNMAYMTDILLADKKVVETFDRKIGPLRGKMFSNTQESQILASIRDALLPKLLSGEIRVKNAEKYLY